MKKFLVVGFLIANLIAPFSAQAEDVASPPIKLDGSFKMKITPVAGLNLTTTTITSNLNSAFQSVGTSETTGAGYSAGILVGLIFYPRWITEFGLIYSHQKFGYHINDPTDNFVGDINATFNTLQVPLVERYEFLPGLSAGGGVYYAHGVGSISASSNFIVDSNGSSTFENSDFRRNDFGLVFNARGEVPISSGTAAVFDFRYLLGLVNLDTDGDPDNASELREVQFLAGLSFEF